MKVALLIASEGFEHTEYRTPKRLLEEAGVDVVTVSDQGGEAVGKDGSMQNVDIALEDFNPKDVDGVFAIGGPGALEHLDNQETNRIFNEAMLLQLPYGAICISPRILARANVLVGKKATGWDGDNALTELYAQNNVEYVREPVVVDGDVITASGPEAVEKFGEAIVSMVKKYDNICT